MSLSRRKFLASSAALAAAPRILTARGANEKLNLAVIGVADRGAANLAGVQHENIAVLCDVDDDRLGKAHSQFPKATTFTDYRKLFDKLDKTIDAVVVSTPDHSHCLPACLAMSMGKPVYCEKPLAYSVNEVRLMRRFAAEKKLVTQMGTQIHAGDNYRRVVEIVRSGMLGPIERVHVWLNGKPPAGKKLGTKPSAKFDIDLWLGPAKDAFFEATAQNPTKQWPHYHWRYWWEFGGGMLADFGCHYMDLPYWALNLTSPTTIAATGKKTYAGDNTTPDLMQVDYKFPAVKDRPGVHLTWYQGVSGPSLDGSAKNEGFGSGVQFIGSKGQLFADYGRLKIVSGTDITPPPKSIPSSIGHHKEWTEAVKTGGPTTCNFAYSGLLAEAVLLGNVSYRAGQEITWDAAKGTTNVPAAEQYLGRDYRKGWELPKL
ncbi:MAG: Gfo/Idh/MocA family oxidoreductase [Gemmataceae bacterium]